MAKRSAKRRPTPAAPRKRPCGKLCCKGLCPCRQPVGKTGARLAAKLPKRMEQLERIFGSSRNIPAELLLEKGTGEGKLGNVRIDWAHFDPEELKFATKDGEGATA